MGTPIKDGNIPRGNRYGPWYFIDVYELSTAWSLRFMMVFGSIFPFLRGCQGPTEPENGPETKARHDEEIGRSLQDLHMKLYEYRLFSFRLQYPKMIVIPRI